MDILSDAAFLVIAYCPELRSPNLKAIIVFMHIGLTKAFLSIGSQEPQWFSGSLKYKGFCLIFKVLFILPSF